VLKRQIARFAVVGVIATLTHLGFLVLGVEWLGMNPVIASVLGFIAAVIISYILNHRWTFESDHAHSSTLWRYVVVSLFGLALNTVMMTTLVQYFHWWYFWAQLSVLLVVPLSNFLLNRYWTFNTRRGAHTWIR
jgi:putative flippase GtrA